MWSEWLLAKAQDDQSLGLCGGWTGSAKRSKRTSGPEPRLCRGWNRVSQAEQENQWTLEGHVH